MKREDIVFYRKLWIIGLPIAMQNFLQSALNMIDVFMVGKLGESAISSVGIANQLFFLLVLIMFGINSGASVFIAQYWGKRDSVNIKKITGIALMITVVAAIILSVIAICIPEKFMSWFIGKKDVEVITLGAGYLKITGIGYIFTALSLSVSMLLRSIGKTRLPMYVSLLSFIINIVLNYILIYGKMGFPEMGVNGSAVATTIARTVEFILIFYFIYKLKYEIAGKLSEFLNFNWLFLKRFLYTAVPVMMNELMWASGIVMYNLIYSRMGREAVAAVNIENSIEKMAFVIFMGTASAAGAIIGKSIGAGREREAYNYGVKIIKIGIFLSVIVAVTIAVSGQWLMSFYNVSEGVHKNAVVILFIFSAYLVIKIINLHNIVGILRSGGDTRYAFVLDILGMWIIGIPLGFIGAFYFHFPVYIVFFILNLEEIFKLVLGLIRFRSKKWIKNLTISKQENK